MKVALLRGLVACFLSIAVGLPAQAATISGTVKAVGKALPGAGSGGGGYGSRKFKFVEQVDYGSFDNFVVFLEGDGLGRADHDGRAVMLQKDAEFLPEVLVIEKGTTVEWPNEDEIFHNAFSYSSPKPFDLGAYKKGVYKAVNFENTGRVDVFCSIHEEMSSIIYVVPNRFFSVADNSGQFLIDDVPPGRYRVTAWHSRLPSSVIEVEVVGDQPIQLDIEMGVKNLPQY
jgi:plastocyanin